MQRISTFQSREIKMQWKYVLQYSAWHLRKTSNALKGYRCVQFLTDRPQSYGASVVIWDHSVTCHPTQVNAPHHNPSQIGWYSIYQPRRDGRLSWVGGCYMPKLLTCSEITQISWNSLSDWGICLKGSSQQQQVIAGQRQCLQAFKGRPQPCVLDTWLSSMLYIFWGTCYDSIHRHTYIHCQFHRPIYLELT